jgi:hypothetical protein
MHVDEAVADGSRSHEGAARIAVQAEVGACDRAKLQIVNDGTALELHVESLLRSAGLEPQRRQKIRGARHLDEFDVVVDITSLGLSSKWVIECKDTSAKVKKDVVVGFCGRVENIGADKGIMVSTSGYQSGCWAAVENRSVHLLVTSQLEEFLGDEIAWASLRRARPRLDALIRRLESMQVRGSRAPGSPFRRGFEQHFPTGPESDRFSERLAALEVLFAEVTNVLAGDRRFRLPDLEYEEDPEQMPPDDWYPTLRVRGVRAYEHAVTGYLDEWESWADRLVPPG